MDSNELNEILARTKELNKNSEQLLKKSKSLAKQPATEREELDQLLRQAALQALDIMDRSEAILMAIQYLKKK